MEERGKSFIILLSAVVILAILSLFNWEKLSGGYFKSFDLVSDLRDVQKDYSGGGNNYLDPDLAMLQDESHYEYIDDSVSVGSQSPANDIEEMEKESESKEENQEYDYIDSDSEPLTVTGSTTYRMVENAGEIIEDYSVDGSNLSQLRAGLSEASDKIMRIAVLGDSYIEGDIFTEGIRESLQDVYGGNGIGYTPVYSEIPGFRHSVRQSCVGFEPIDFRNKSGRNDCLLQGVAFKAGESASSTFSGSKKTPHAESWSETTILLKAPEGGSLRLKSGSGSEASWTTYNFDASDKLQSLKVSGPTDKISLDGITPGMVIAGVYLDGTKGVAVDNMSIRGYSGIRHNEISSDLTRQSRNYIDYRLIILEFGINALSSSQTNYNAYGQRMSAVVEYLKKLYPHAVIMIMGIGDRGEKRGGEMHSMATVTNMIDVQRRVARDTGSLFWDTRSAMGGEDSVVDWVSNKEINKDYIHLSFLGGKRLSKLFIDALNNSL